jgi:hypothetical protein
VSISALCLALPVFSQTFTANLTGVVSDPGSAAVPRAVVNLKNTATGEPRRAVSAEDGRYTFSLLLPGTYELTVEAPGFKKFVAPSIPLLASQVAEVNISLQLGDVSQSVEVEAAAAAVDTQTANKNVTLTQRMVAELPVNSRIPFVQVHATAGVAAVRTGVSTSTADQNHDRFALNGGRDEGSAILIDGVPATATDWGGLIAAPGVDSVQETQVTRSSFDAQYGKTDGGVVALVTKGGSNTWHATGFEYLRNDKLDANSWANNRAGIKRTAFHRSQFGGNASGPIWSKKRLYFFAGYEGLQLSSPSVNVSTVPTSLERNGDFSKTLNADRSVSLIYDPFSSRPNPSGAGLIRDPFPGNVIPQDRFDPVGKKIVNLYPQPNTPGDLVTNALNFALGGKAVTHDHRLDARVDWAKSEKYTFFARVTKAWQEDLVPTFFGNGADSNYNAKNPRQFIAVGNTFVPTPNWVINVLLGSGRWQEFQISTSQGQGGAITGLPAPLLAQLQATTIPQFSIAGYSQIGNSRYLSFPRQNDNLQVNASKEHAGHSIKFGLMIESGRLNDTDINNGTFNFTRGLTSGPSAAVNSTTTGNSVASLLLGSGASGSIPINNIPAYLQMYYGFYGQDTWRATQRLTINAGLRFEHQSGRTERYNRLNWFDTGAKSPIAERVGLPLVGGLEFASSSRRALWDADPINVAPRVGIAYKFTDKLVVRTGFGMYYPIASGLVAPVDGFSTTSTWVATQGGGGLVPADLISNPFPQGLNKPVGATQGFGTLLGESITAFQRSHPSGYSMNYSLDIQYEISKGTIVEIGYIGTQGRKLLLGVAANVNQLNPQYLALGSGLDQQVANPFQGVIASGVLGGATLSRQQLLRPYPQFQTVNEPVDTPSASSSFNALSLKFNKRFDKGMSILATYQWSKAIDNSSETQGWEVGDAFRNVYDFSVERSISAHDIPQSLVTAFVYELPVGKGKPLGANMNKVLNALVGGWQVSGIIRLQSGLPLQFAAANTLGPYGFGVARPNIADLKALTQGTRSPDHWFNTAAVTQPAAYTIGNAPRWIPNVRFETQHNADLAFGKNFPIFERLKLQYRAEMFNLTNTPQYGKASTTLGAPDFGRISGLAPGALPRNIQMAVRLEF